MTDQRTEGRIARDRTMSTSGHHALTAGGKGSHVIPIFFFYFPNPIFFLQQQSSLSPHLVVLPLVCLRPCSPLCRTPRRGGPRARASVAMELQARGSAVVDSGSRPTSPLPQRSFAAAVAIGLAR